MSNTIRIIELSPRDGLQNEKISVPTSDKLDLIKALLNSGLNEIEVSSFVSPKWVPQLGDIAELWPLLPNGGLYSALVPNSKGLDRAIELDVERIAVFTAASDAFTKNNINMTVAESIDAFRNVIHRFREEQTIKGKNAFVRAYVSTIFECPFTGLIEPKKVVEVIESLLELDIDEISLGDTTGVGVPREVNSVIRAISHIPKDKVIWHFHDTRGTAISNVATALENGYCSFDSSAGGLGGCPYAPGAGGNLATEDLVYFAERTGLKSGVDLNLLSHASLNVLKVLNKAPSSKAQIATLATC